MIGEVAPIFSVHYPSHFAQRFGDELESVMAEYALVVQQNGLKRADVERGVTKIRLGRAGKWLPNPNEFAELCKLDAEELGQPTMDEVDADLKARLAWVCAHPIRKYRYKTRMTELVAMDIMRKYRMASDEKQQKLLSQSYNKWLEVARKGELPPTRQAISSTTEPLPTGFQNDAKLGRTPKLAPRFEKHLREKRAAG